MAARDNAIVIWAVGAWYFGIPTSESHSLIAGLTGAAIALGGISGVNLGEWMKVIYGLILSTVLGFGAGFGICRLITLLFFNANRHGANRFFDTAQVFGAAAMAFMHGAQDGQKFLGVLLLAFNILASQAQLDSLTMVLKQGQDRLAALRSQFSGRYSNVEEEVKKIEDSYGRSFDAVYSEVMSDYGTYTALKSMSDQSGADENCMPG